MNILLLFGTTLLLTTLTSFVCVKIKVPQVIGHILMGVCLGISGVHLFSLETSADLVTITYFALAMIGFTIGGELRWARLKRFGKSIFLITMFETMLSCVIVFTGIFLLTGNLPLSLLLGALSSATAPGGTTTVIQEYRARGPLTSTLYGVVGADDAFAIIIFAVMSGFAKVFVGASEVLNYVDIFSHVLFDIGGAFLLGIILGLFFSFWMLMIRNAEVRHLVTLISIFICAGLSMLFNVSIILSSMMMGIIIGNIRPHRARSYFVSLQSISAPLYMLFFVLIGARLDLTVLFSMGSIGVMYFIFRMIGKYFGAFTGAYVAKVPAVIRKNIGFCLFSQAGVAIGLAISTDIEFSKYNLEAQQLGSSIVTIVTASTLIFQIIGPIMTKHALFNARETHV